MTLDVYAGLFGDDLDAVATRLNEAAAARDAAYLRTGTAGGEVVDLGNGEAQVVDLGFLTEPPEGIEPSTYALRDQVGYLRLPGLDGPDMRQCLSASLSVGGRGPTS
ncbi:hypothetical protein AB0873_31895 [Micromonospora sp. NPDC047707]|uniref:hypothetical protein n=1 Tax=Micromonospora sp. NPDC047707 TaxID=3154498 RepID=UPI003455709C